MSSHLLFAHHYALAAHTDARHIRCVYFVFNFYVVSQMFAENDVNGTYPNSFSML